MRMDKRSTSRAGIVGIIAVGILGSLMGVVLFTMVTSALCGQRTVTVGWSPDGQYRAAIEQSDCGATTPSLTRLRIEDHSVPPIPFLQRGADVIAFDGGAHHLTIRWAAQRQLAATYNGECCWIREQIAGWKDVAVSYRGRCPGPPMIVTGIARPGQPAGESDSGWDEQQRHL
jgi:hypothetical protein